MNSNRAFQAVLFVLTLFALATSALCAPPRWDLSKTGSSLSKDIDNRINYWSGIMKNARKQDDVIAARKGLLNDYSYAEDNGRGYAYTARAAELLVPLVNTDNSLIQVNVAMALCGMAEESLQEGLEKLNTHSNQAVRYHATKGYRESRMKVLARGENAADRMFKALNDRAERETSPYVLEQLFLALNFPDVKPEFVSQSMYSSARRRAFGVLKGAWKRYCRMLAGGRRGMAGACSTALEAVRNLEKAIGTQEVSKDALQMAADAAFAAALAYDNAYTGETIGESVTMMEVTLLPKAVLEKLQQDGTPVDLEKFVLKLVQGSSWRLEVDKSQSGDDAGQVNVKITVPFKWDSKLVRPGVYWIMIPAGNVENLKRTIGSLAKTGFEVTFRPKRILAENTLLLIDCEKALNALTRSAKTNIQDALGDEDAPDRGAAVRLAVLNWIEQLQGVSKPNIEPSTGATTRPGNSDQK